MIVHLYYYRDVRVQRYANALTARGAQVDVICVRAPDPSLARQTSPVGVYPIPLSHRGHSSGLTYLVEYGVACVLYTLWLLVLYARKRYQVIHVHNMPDFLVFTALIPRLCGAQVILDIHDPMPEFYQSKYCTTDSSRIVKLMRLQEKLSTRFAQAIITANPLFRDNLIARGTAPHKLTVVNNLPDQQVFNRPGTRDSADIGSRLSPDGFTLIYPGTIAPRYGLDIAIRALPLIIPEIPDLRLVIIGQANDTTQELSALAERLQVTAHVEFKPLMPVTQVAYYLSKADLGIYPALSDPHMEIAMPTKVLEYAIMGLPVVASRLRILMNTFTDEAMMFCTPGSVEEFATAVRTLYRDPARRARLVSEANRVFVQSHSWEQEQLAYFDLLRALLGQRAGVLASRAAEQTRHLS